MLNSKNRKMRVGRTVSRSEELEYEVRVDPLRSSNNSLRTQAGSFLSRREQSAAGLVKRSPTNPCLYLPIESSLIAVKEGKFVITLITFWFMYPLMRDKPRSRCNSTSDRSGNLLIVLLKTDNERRVPVAPWLQCVSLKKPDSHNRVATSLFPKMTRQVIHVLEPGTAGR